MPREEGGGWPKKPKPKTPLSPLILGLTPKSPKWPPPRVALQGQNIPEGLGLPPASGFPWPGQYDPEGLGLPATSSWVQQENRNVAAWNAYIRGQGGGGSGPPPAPPPTPAGVKPIWDVKWKPASYGTPGGNKPGWWVNLEPVDPADAERPDVQYLMMLNTSIPYLSPEDQRNAAAQLYVSAADGFSYYKPDKIGAVIPHTADTIRMSAQTGLTPIDTEYFSSARRAKDVITALSNMREATVQGNRWKLGAGYTWLQQIAGALSAYGGQGPEERQSKTQYAAMLGQLDPLLSMGQSSEIGPFANIGRLLASPFFSQAVLGSQKRNPLLNA